jgi:hypothetical protein
MSLDIPALKTRRLLVRRLTMADLDSRHIHTWTSAGLIQITAVRGSTGHPRVPALSLAPYSTREPATTRVCSLLSPDHHPR